MKKAIPVLIVMILAVSLLASCGSYKGDSGSSSNSSNSGGGVSYDSGPVAEAQEKPTTAYPGGSASAGGGGESGVVPITDPVSGAGLADKIIYTVNADIETISFDETIEKVYSLLSLNNAFIENSYIGGRNYAQSYYGWQTFRTANFTLRVPKDRLNAVRDGLSGLGNVTSLRSDAENITSQFYDTQSRLNSYRTQEERLLDMLAQADNVPDMISIEQRLADVRYSIESLTTTLTTWQNQVDYSTVSLYINEVETFTEIAPVQQRTYWQQVGDGFKSRMKGVGEFFKDLFKWIIVNLPVLAILAVIVTVLILVAKRLSKRGKKKDYTSYSADKQNTNHSGPDPGSSK